MVARSALRSVEGTFPSIWLQTACPTPFFICRPALTRRWTEKLGVNPKMLTPTLTYINFHAKVQKG